jgi:hypothetical protein
VVESVWRRCWGVEIRSVKLIHREKE